MGAGPGSAGKAGVSLAAVLAVLAAITNMLTATHTEMTAMRPPPIVLPFSIVLKNRLTAPSSPRWMAFSKPNRAFIPLPPAVNSGSAKITTSPFSKSHGPDIGSARNRLGPQPSAK